MRDGLGDLQRRDVVGQCISLHYRLIPVFEEWLGCPALLTLGWVDDKTDTGMLRFDDGFIEEKLKSGHASTVVNIHAWLTLPTLEVVDFSLATTVGAAQNKPEMNGSVIAKYADDLNGMAYKPMLVGHDFLQKSGMMLWIPTFGPDI